ncbi:MAG: preprotein translocase subunit SecE [Clostridia bacterium]|nr:preprotein translocase subunit SecE [Clostridia bacterium]
MADANVNKKAGGNKIVKYFKECKAELKKVTWPDKEQLIHNTGIILVFIAIVTVILSLLDVGFAKLFQFLTGLL